MDAPKVRPKGERHGWRESTRQASTNRSLLLANEDWEMAQATTHKIQSRRVYFMRFCPRKQEEAYED